MKEQWKKIIINELETFYSVSSLGAVRNDSSKTLLGGSVSGNGYHMVHLRARVNKNCSVHRLVLKAFDPNPEMNDLQVNHKDGNKLNNELSNLEWSTALENMRHSYLSGLQKNEMRECFQYTLKGEFVRRFENSKSAAQELKMDYSTILRCVKEEVMHYGSFQFKSYQKSRIPEWFNLNRKEVFLYDDEGIFIKSYSSQKECAKDLQIGIASVSRYVNNKRKLKGFVLSKTAL